MFARVDPQMDLLLVTGRFPERSETFIYRKAVGLAARGHRVTVAARQVGDWALYTDPLPPSLRVVKLTPDSMLRQPRRALLAMSSTLRTMARAPKATRGLVRSVRGTDHAVSQFLRHLGLLDLRTDVVHLENLSLAAMYPFAAASVGAPVVVSCRGSDVHTLEQAPPKEREASVTAIRNAAAVHCVSQRMADEVARLSGRTKGLWVNRPAVDVERILPRPINGGADGPVRLLTTGRLVWKKGFDYLLAALAVLVRRGVDFQMEILGDGPLWSYMRFSIGDLGLERHVKLVGAVASAEVLARLQSTDLFVLSSVAEGISNAVLEAMASGVPVVTTSAGGMAEAVTDGVEGFVVGVRDVTMLATRIATLIGDHEIRRTMGRAARARAVAEFSLTRQLATFEQIYQSVQER